MPSPPTLVAASFGTTTTGTTATTGTISWQIGDVVVCIYGNEGVTGTMGTPTNTGSGLSWTVQQSVDSSSNNICGAAVATAVATADSSGTVTAGTIASSQHNFTGVYVLRGSDGVGNSTITAVPSSTKTISLTPTAADSTICWGVFDFSSDTVQTETPTASVHSSGSPGPSATPQETQVSPFYTYYWCELDDQTSGGAVSYGIGGANAGPFSILALEVKGSASVAAPGRPIQQDPLTPFPLLQRVVRQTSLWRPPVGADDTITQPPVTTQDLPPQPGRARQRFVRRALSRIVTPTPASQGAVTTQALPAQPGRVRLRFLPRIRRSETAAPPPAPTTAPPAVVQRRARVPFKARRGSATVVPARAQIPPLQPARARARLALRKRAQVVTPTPAGVALPTTQALPPQPARRHPWLPIRARRSATIPTPVGAPPPPTTQALPPQPARRRSILPRARRSITQTPIAPGVAAPTTQALPPQPGRARRRLLPSRTGLVAGPPAPGVTPPPAVTTRRRLLLAPRGRQRIATPPPARVTTGPVPPQPRRRRLVRLPRWLMTRTRHFIAIGFIPSPDDGVPVSNPVLLVTTSSSVLTSAHVASELLLTVSSSTLELAVTGSILILTTPPSTLELSS